MPYYLGVQLVHFGRCCQACRLNAVDIGFLCQACHDEVLWLPMPMVLGLSDGLDKDKKIVVQPATFNTSLMKRSIKAFKDKENLQTLPYLIHGLYVLADWLHEQNLPDDAQLITMPTTNKRLAKRGFAPVDILGRYLSSLTGLPLYNGAVRVRDGEHQRHLDKYARLSNVVGAFALTDDLSSSTVVIFDDVSTTGASIQALANAIISRCPDVHVMAVCLAHGS